MKQLTLGDILALVTELKRAGMPMVELNKLPIYIGNDDELNGIHTAWYIEQIDFNDYNSQYIVEMINEDHCNIKIQGRAILVS